MNLRGLDFMVDDPTSAAILLCFRKERDRLNVLSGAEILDSVGQYYVEAIQLGQHLGAVRTDLPLELLVLTAQSVAAACDQWFISNPAAAKKPQRKLHAKRFAELIRRLLERTENVAQRARRG